MPDIRIDILNREYNNSETERGVLSLCPVAFPSDLVRPVLNAMDENGKRMCLELLEYMAKNNVRLSIHSTPNAAVFSHKGKLLTKEQLFENFL